MAPIKFEDNIKDKLEKRTLSPSEGGWSQIAERLDKDDKISKKPLFLWLSVAAGLIIMLAITIQFFNNSEAEFVMPKVVEGQLKNEELKNEQDHKDQLKLAAENHTTKGNKTEVVAQNPPQGINYKKVKRTVSQPKIQLSENNNTPLKNQRSNGEVILRTDTSKGIDEAAMKTAVADVLKELKSEKTSTTEREVDSLLKEASKALFKDRLQKESSKTVDAKALLISVEDDMGQSFRSKVFDALKGSYETVKTAVVQRNN